MASSASYEVRRKVQINSEKPSEFEVRIRGKKNAATVSRGKVPVAALRLRSSSPPSAENAAAADFENKLLDRFNFRDGGGYSDNRIAGSFTVVGNFLRSPGS